MVNTLQKRKHVSSKKVHMFALSPDTAETRQSGIYYRHIFWQGNE